MKSIRRSPRQSRSPPPTVRYANLSQQAARGSDTNPMSDRDLEEKLRDAALSWNPRHDVAPLIDAIWQVDKSTDVAQLAAMTVPHG